MPTRSLSSITCVTGAVVTTEAPLRGDKMKITSNTGGELFLDLNYGEVVATVSTGAIAKLKGIRCIWIDCDQQEHLSILGISLHIPIPI